jgi:hypothetical protein
MTANSAATSARCPQKASDKCARAVLLSEHPKPNLGSP